MRKLSEIANEIQQDWITRKEQRIVTHALPYLHAMRSLDSVDDSYGLDDGRSVVLYFLANAGQWRGEKAREIKKELNKMIKF